MPSFLKWFFVLCGFFIVGKVGWEFTVNHYEKKGVPRSHVFGYLIYGNEYLTGGTMVNLQQKVDGGISTQSGSPIDAKSQPSAPVPVTAKTKESIKKEYGMQLQKTLSEKDKLALDAQYYFDLMSFEGDSIKKSSLKESYIEASAKLYAINNTPLEYRKKRADYEDVNKRIRAYRQNGVQPPPKLLKMQKTKPDEKIIYNQLYLQEKARLNEGTQ